jgi:hypothetical protein
MIQAINPKNQSLVNKTVKYLEKYFYYNDLRDSADDEGDVKTWKAYDKKCADTFDKYLEHLHMLPKGQQTIIDELIF